ncbi:hypothetical protein GF373_06540 [bacterium]|nr:hypothetical protein [bacterium]
MIPPCQESHSMNGDLQNQYQQLRSRACIYNHSRDGKIRISGPDRKTFLHGLVTNEVNRLSAYSGNYALHLTPRGKILSAFWVFDRGNDLFLLAPPSCRMSLISTLDKYLIMEDAEFEDVSDSYSLISLIGPESESVARNLFPQLKIPVELNTCATQQQNAGCETLFRINRCGELGYDLLLNAEQEEKVLSHCQKDQIPEATPSSLEIRRMEAGIPAFGRELTEERFPQEAGLFHAISFEKGCYIGQETVARLQHRGHVNRELTGFILETDTVPDGLPVFYQEEKPIGQITSVCYSFALGKVIALGYLRSEKRKPGMSLQGQAEEKEVTAVVTDLPFLS